jgi:hypothetical protein
MSTFTLRGHRGSQIIEMTWTDGQLTGDPEAIEMVQALAAAMEGQVVSSPADITTHDHLSNPASAASLMDMMFSSRSTCVYSDVPPMPEPPEGAIP